MDPEESFISQDTVPISLSVYDRYVEDNSDGFASRTEGDVDVVATLTPLNDSASRAFHSLALLKQQGGLPYHGQFIHAEERKESGESTPTAPSPRSSDSVDILTDNGERRQSITSGGPLLKGFYRLSLSALPEFPALGWRIGKGREGLPNRGVDLLLAPHDSPEADVAGIHARCNWIPSSAGFFLIADNARGKPVFLNAERVQLDRRVIINPSMIAFGNLIYRFDYIQRNKAQEDRFQQYLEYFFNKVHYERPPIVSPTPTGKEALIGEFLMGEAIARGAFGQVSMAKHRITGDLVAVKEILKTKGNAMSVDREVEICLSLRDHKHNHVVSLVADVLYMDCQSYAATKNIINNTDSTYRPGWNDALQKVYLFTPLGYGTFHSLFNSEVSRSGRVIFFKQALEGLSFLHDLRIMHRDIKPANLIIKKYDPPDMAISDFGCATQEESVLYDRPGTVPYLAPEQRDGLVHTKAVDMWSLGLVGTELFGRRRPQTKVDSESWRQMHKWLQTADQTLVPIASLLRDMLQWHPEERTTAKAGLMHESLIDVSTTGLGERTILNAFGEKRKQRATSEER